jgi:hypothetical protein
MLGIYYLITVMDFIYTLKARNETLFLFGLVCLVFALVCYGMTWLTSVQVYQVNAWFKPLKFALSTFLFAWAMAWYCFYLKDFNPKIFNWTVILLLGFEIVYITIMASMGKTSHYNTSNAFYSAMFSAMAVAATIVTLYTGYIGYLFFKADFPELPSHYVWSIRCGMILFVIFSFEGFAMGSRLSHTVGAINDNSNIWILGWSRAFGDLRVAHFIGMHALQVLPFLSYYVLRDTRLTIFMAILYTLLASFVLFQALQGKSFWSAQKRSVDQVHSSKEE